MNLYEHTIIAKQDVGPSELKQLTEKYGDKMSALLMDPDTNQLNANGTMYVDSKGRRVFIEDTLEDGETIAFLVGIAGG